MCLIARPDPVPFPRAFYADRLQHNLERTAALAREQGLTPERLEELLADES